MATRVTSLERARMVLAIFQMFHCRPGDGLGLGNLIMTGAKHGLDAWEIDVGLDIGREHGWFETGPDRTIGLTKSGSEVLSADAGVVHSIAKAPSPSDQLLLRQGFQVNLMV
jgi:hypothetical protein